MEINSSSYKLQMQVIRTVLLLGPLWAHAASQTSPYKFRNVRINGGGFVASTIFNAAVNGLYYARTDMGGVYRWNISRWVPLLDDLGVANQSYLGTLSLATDPIEPNRVYLACGLYTGPTAAEAAVLYSADYGSLGSWTAVPLPGVRLGGNEDGRSAGERIVSHPSNNSIVYLGTSQNGLWWSLDKGVTWAPNPSWPSSATQLMFVLPHKRSGLLFVGVRTSGSISLQWSADNGVTWASVPGAPSSLIPYRGACDADGSTLYFTYSDQVGPNGMSTGKLWRVKVTQQAGASSGWTAAWTDVTPAQSPGGGFAGVSADALMPAVVMVTTMDRWSPDLIYRSIDGGTTWTELVHNAVTVSDSPWITFHDATNTPSWTGWMGDIAIDPFNSSHVLHGTGQGLWSSGDVTAADVGAPTTWYFDNDGLEETVPLELVTPPSGPALVSAIGDIDGFRHDDLDVTPSQGMFNPSWGTSSSIDVAWLKPDFYVRTHALGYGRNNIIYGSYSVDGAYNWTLFPSQPPGAGQDPIAVSADGAVIVWHGYYSKDVGATWVTCGGGLPSSAHPVADRVNASVMYAYSSGVVWRSTDGGQSFTQGATGLQGVSNFMRVNWAVEGELWLPTYSGLLRSTDGGESFLPVGDGGSASPVYSVGLGAPLTPGQPAAVYIHGQVQGEEGFWRSDDAAGSMTSGPVSWIRVNDWDSKYGFVMFVQGDVKTAGRMYVATNGRGILVGDMQA